MTTLPPEVMDDLLTLYLAGEASPASRQLVDEYARTHVEFAAALRSANELELPASPARPAPDLELAALKKTREYFRLRSIFMGAGIFFSLLPFSFRAGAGGFEWLVIGYANNGIVWASASLAAANWVACWLMDREVRKAGL
ncbi:MAG: hypothetical protein IPP47_12680 [Bryobacterales bacterium]|nr:hypothetical protein [Bryobacterales bacterium]